MARKVRTHVMIGDTPTFNLRPKHLTKMEFAKRVYRLMLNKGWHAAELARQAGLERAAIGTYLHGKTFPSPTNLAALAKALGVTPEELLPNTVESAIDEDNPSFEIKASDNAPGLAWLRINRLVTMETATKIATLIGADNATDREGSR